MNENVIKIRAKDSRRAVKREAKKAAQSRNELREQYMHRVEERCIAVLPFSAEELSAAGVPTMESSSQKLAAWWALVIFNILLDDKYIPSEDEIDANDVLPKYVKDYLYYQAVAFLVTDNAVEWARPDSVLFKGDNVINDLEQCKILDLALRLSTKIRHGHIELADAEAQLEKSICYQLGKPWSGHMQSVSPVHCTSKKSQKAVNRDMGTYRMHENEDTTLGLVALYAVLEKRAKRHYCHNILEHSKCLPLSQAEMHNLGISSPDAPAEQMVAWWMFVISAVLTDSEWISTPCLKSFDLPYNLQSYLIQQADSAAKQFWGEIPYGFSNAEILRYAWKTAVWDISRGALSRDEAKSHIAEMIGNCLQWKAGK